MKELNHKFKRKKRDYIGRRLNAWNFKNNNFDHQKIDIFFIKMAI